MTSLPLSAYKQPCTIVHGTRTSDLYQPTVHKTGFSFECILVYPNTFETMRNYHIVRNSFFFRHFSHLLYCFLYNKRILEFSKILNQILMLMNLAFPIPIEYTDSIYPSDWLILLNRTLFWEEDKGTYPVFHFDFFRYRGSCFLARSRHMILRFILFHFGSTKYFFTHFVIFLDINSRCH